MNAMLLAMAAMLPGQTYVYEGRETSKAPSAATLRQHQAALSGLRAREVDRIERLTWDATVRTAWATDRQQAQREVLAYQTEGAMMGQFGGSTTVKPEAADGVQFARAGMFAPAEDPRVKEYQALRDRLNRIEHQNHLLAGQRRAVRGHQDREAQRRAMVEASKPPIVVQR